MGTFSVVAVFEKEYSTTLMYYHVDKACADNIQQLALSEDVEPEQLGALYPILWPPSSFPYPILFYPIRSFSFSHCSGVRHRGVHA
jgi:hypothetical protein